MCKCFSHSVNILMTETSSPVNNLYLYDTFFISVLYFNLMNWYFSVREWVLGYCLLISLPCVYFPQLDTLHFFSSGSSNAVILFVHPVCLDLLSQCISTGTWEITLEHKLIMHFSSNLRKEQTLERYTHSQQIFAFSFLSSRQSLQKELAVGQ